MKLESAFTGIHPIYYDPRVGRITDVLRMFYNFYGINYIVSGDKNRALIKLLIDRNPAAHTSPYTDIDSSVCILANLETESCKQKTFDNVYILPISQNLLAVSSSSEENEYIIEFTVLNRDTFEVIHTYRDSRKTNLFRADSVVIDRHGFLEVVTENKSRINIYGQEINIDNTFKKVCDSIFFSKIKLEIRVFDDCEKMQLQQSIKLNTHNDSVEYLCVSNKKDRKTYLDPIMLIYFNKSNHTYAYNFNDKQLHKVIDNREYIGLHDFKVLLENCMTKCDSIETKQYMYDCVTLDNGGETRFGYVFKSEGETGRLYLRSLKQCINEYQYNFNGEVLQKITQQETEIGDEVQRISLSSPSMYKANTLDLLSKLRRSRGIDNIEISSEVVTREYIEKTEGLGGNVGEL